MNQVQMAAKLYECRDTAKRFFRDEYKAKLEPYTHIIQAVMKANNLEEIPALLKISQTETSKYYDSEFLLRGDMIRNKIERNKNDI
jgi:hypothetical protein